MYLKQIKKHVTISQDSNTKTGAIPYISLPRKITCNPKAPCIKKGCYALKFKRFSNCIESMNKNYNTWQTDKNLYFLCINEYLHIKQPKMFRFHVSGDIPNKYYLNRIINTAKYHPDIKFLAFTKKYQLVLNESTVPTNLSIVLSSWVNFPLPKQSKYPIAYYQDGTETRVTNAIECFGSCETCGMCWNLKELGKNVVFHKH